jgi:tryptophanyl-tRNA synthetase
MQFKTELGELTASGLSEIQNNLKRIRSDPQYVNKILANGAR